MTPQIKIFDTPELLAESFADFFADEVAKHSRYNIALSGGSTPKIIFKILADEFANKIEWHKVHFFWGDERCVSPNSDESNYRMTKEFLFDEIKIPEENIHRIKGEAEPAEEAIRYSDEIRNSLPIENGLPCFNFVMLGLGEDGHTASIFPDRLDLFQSNKICEAVQHPVSLQNRITITGNIINNSTAAAFFVTGKEKSYIVSKIINSRENLYPASNIKLQKGALTWYLDNSSAIFLK